MGSPRWHPTFVEPNFRHLKAPHRPESPSCQVPPLFWRWFLCGKKKVHTWDPNFMNSKFLDVPSAMTCLLRGIYIYTHIPGGFFLLIFVALTKADSVSTAASCCWGAAAAAAKEGEKKALPTKSPLQQVGILKFCRWWWWWWWWWWRRWRILLKRSSAGSR